MTRLGRAACAAVLAVMVGPGAWAASDVLAPARQAAPPPPRRLDTQSMEREDAGTTQSASQGQYCQSLLDQIKALPKPPAAADGRPAPASERQRLDDAYRKQCATLQR